MSEHTPQYENEQKRIKKNIVETTDVLEIKQLKIQLF